MTIRPPRRGCDVVGEDDPESGSVFTLDAFLARARVVLAEHDRPPLHLVG